MAGYMGFGMANWIYTQRPKKAFSKGRSKPSCNTLDTYSRQFKIQPSKKSSNLYIVMSLVLIGLVYLTVFYKIPDFMAYSKQLEVQKQERIVNFNNNAFQFLMSSGLTRLRNHNLEGAYSEFELAYAIYPENEQLNQLILETLSVLCEDGNRYCSDLELHLNTVTNYN